jgi:hypothetical protein
LRRRGLRRQELKIPAPASDPLIAALAILFLGRVLFTGEVLLPAGYLRHFHPWQAAAAAAPGHQEHWNALTWDAMAQYYPWRSFAHDSLSRGVIPLWNPFQFCGMPFVANSQSAVFYPPNVIFDLLDPARAFAFSAALHLFLAGLFAYMFLRALGLGRFGSSFGGMVFAFCGFLAAWIQLPTVMNTAVWLPLTLFFIARYFDTRSVGYVVGMGLALGSALLAGHPQVFLFVAGAAAAYFIFRALTAEGAFHRRVCRGVIAGAAVAALALLWGAVQLLPAAELLPLSHRATVASAQGYSAYLRFAMPWQQLITLALPEFMGNPVYGTYWGRGNLAEYAAYAGVLPLILAVLGIIWRRDKHAIFFAAVAACALLLALGTPLNLPLFYGVPGFSSTGGPARMLFIYSAAVALLAGMGADAAAKALAADPALARRFARHLIIGSLAAALAAAAFILVLAATLGTAPGNLLEAPASNIVVMLLALAVAAGGSWIAARRIGISPEVALGLLFAASVLELFAFGMAYYRTAPRAQVYPPTEVTDYLKSRAAVGRILPLYRAWGLERFPVAVLPPNSAMVYGLSDAQGYDSLYLARYRSVLAAVEGRDPSPAANGNMLLGALGDPSLLPALGVAYVVSPAPLNLPGLELERSGEVNIYRVEKFLPRAYMARNALASTDLAGSLAGLKRAAEGSVVLEASEKMPPATPVPGARSAVTVLKQDLNRVRLKAWQAGYVVLSDAYYPGWRAWVDGKPAQIIIANGAFRAVQVRPGEHDVEMRFEPVSFRIGLFATLLAAAVGIAAAAFGLTARRGRGRCDRQDSGTR